MTKNSYLFGLLFICCFLTVASFAEVRMRRTVFVLDNNHYPNALEKYQASEIYLLCNLDYPRNDSTWKRSYEKFVKGDTAVVNLVGQVWMLSIGIDNYESVKYDNCESDASGYMDFFKKQYQKFISSGNVDFFHGYLLLNSNATKDSILKVLKEISSRASYNDYFIFNFSGLSDLYTSDSVNFTSRFFPYDVAYDTVYHIIKRSTNDTANAVKSLIPQKTLQEYVNYSSE